MGAPPLQDPELPPRPVTQNTIWKRERRHENGKGRGKLHMPRRQRHRWGTHSPPPTPCPSGNHFRAFLRPLPNAVPASSCPQMQALDRGPAGGFSPSRPRKLPLPLPNLRGPHLHDPR